MCDDDLISVASRAATWGTYRPDSPRVSEANETSRGALFEVPVELPTVPVFEVLPGIHLHYSIQISERALSPFKAASNDRT